jgi:hypothetical protein
MVWLNLALDRGRTDFEQSIWLYRTPAKAIAKWLVKPMARLLARGASATNSEGLKRSYNALWKWLKNMLKGFLSLMGR